MTTFGATDNEKHMLLLHVVFLWEYHRSARPRVFSLPIFFRVTDGTWTMVMFFHCASKEALEDAGKATTI